jgi:glycosyltransferase involved in cell wall biosynthesis
MKVLAIVPDFIEKPSGGLGEQFRHLMEHLEGKVEYYVVGYPEENSIKNYKPARAPFRFDHAALSTINGQSIYFAKALEFKEDFDIIHTFDWSTFYAGWLCKEHFKKPLVCTVNLSLRELNKTGIYYCQDPNTIDGNRINQLQIYYEEFGVIAANKVIQVSEYYNKLYPQQIQDKTKVISNGIEADKWVKKRPARLPGKNKLKFCYIGRASPMKGIDTILNCDIPDDIDFYFIVSEKNAEQPYFNNIKKKANNKNIFHIPGLYGQDKIDFLYAMDGVVMPSIHEPFGIVALEALMSENLFISTGSGGIGEIVEGIEWFEINDSIDLLTTFKKIQAMSEEDKQKIIKRGKERAREFTWSKAADELYKVYSAVGPPKTIEFYTD